MSIEEDIQALLARADRLRGLSDDEPAKVALTVIVDEINRLRAIQAKEAEAAALKALLEPEEPKRGPGRPKKGEQ
jgi:hypothetical protein